MASPSGVTGVGMMTCLTRANEFLKQQHYCIYDYSSQLLIISNYSEFVNRSLYKFLRILGHFMLTVRVFRQKTVDDALKKSRL